MTQFVVVETAPAFNHDRHVSFAIGGGLELVAYVLTYFILSRYGRRLPMSLCQLVTGIVCITVGVFAVLPHSTIAWSGRFLAGYTNTGYIIWATYWPFESSVVKEKN